MNRHPDREQDGSGSPGLNGMLRQDGVQVVIQLVLCCTNIAHTTCFVTRTSSSTEDLDRPEVSQMDGQRHVYSSSYLQYVQDG